MTSLWSPLQGRSTRVPAHTWESPKYAKACKKRESICTAKRHHRQEAGIQGLPFRFAFIIIHYNNTIVTTMSMRMSSVGMHPATREQPAISLARPHGTEGLLQCMAGPACQWHDSTVWSPCGPGEHGGQGQLTCLARYSASPYGVSGAVLSVVTGGQLPGLNCSRPLPLSLPLSTC